MRFPRRGMHHFPVEDADYVEIVVDEQVLRAHVYVVEREGAVVGEFEQGGVVDDVAEDERAKEGGWGGSILVGVSVGITVGVG